MTEQVYKNIWPSMKMYSGYKYVKTENKEKEKKEQKINRSRFHCIAQGSWLQEIETSSGSLK